MEVGNDSLFKLSVNFLRLELKRGKNNAHDPN